MQDLQFHNSIIEKVLLESNVTETELLRKRGKERIVNARRLIANLLWCTNTLTLKEIGQRIGVISHATVLHHKDVVFDLLETNKKEFNKTYNKILESLNMNLKSSPENIQELKENEVFVFGSNLSGYHGGGAAYLAHKKFGAVWGEGIGHFGQTYAIPTKSENIKSTLDVDTITQYVDEFVKYAKSRKDLNFLVTEIGCGLAGYKAKDIYILFKEAFHEQNIFLPESFIYFLLKNKEHTIIKDINEYKESKNGTIKQ